MIYQHYKGGRYDFIGVALVEASLTPVVVYQSEEDGTLWTRPVVEFFGEVTIASEDNKGWTRVKRFTPVADSEH